MDTRERAMLDQYIARDDGWYVDWSGREQYDGEAAAQAADRREARVRELTDEQKMLNVAACVRQYTEVTRRWNGRGKSSTYAASVDAIAGAARQLAEMVEAYFTADLCPTCQHEAEDECCCPCHIIEP
jgi:hypothetical protein